MEVVYGSKKWYEKVGDWFKSLPGKVKEVVKEHPGETMMIVASLITAGSTVAKIASDSKEYQDSVYLTDKDGTINKIPAKRLRTVDVKDYDEEDD